MGDKYFWEQTGIRITEATDIADLREKFDRLDTFSKQLENNAALLPEIDALLDRINATLSQTGPMCELGDEAPSPTYVVRGADNISRAYCFHKKQHSFPV